MAPAIKLLSLTAAFLLIVLASRRIGEFFAYLHLPRITGYLLTGVIAGPFVLNLIPHEATRQLLFIDEISLAFIAFAAGNELYLPELRGRLRTIGWITGGLIFFTLLFSVLAVFLLAPNIPFLGEIGPVPLLGVALLVGSILVARSPSSAIAIVRELRAKGPFTRVALGVTVIMDVLVIVIFAISSSAADALFTGLGLDLTFAVVLLVELALALVAGLGLYWLLDHLLALRLGQFSKTFLLLLVGYGVFLLSTALRSYTHANLPVEILVEPLLVCLIASFLVTNRSPQRGQLGQILHDAGFVVFAVFFTLTGASLELDVLLLTWPITLALFFTRLLGIITGSTIGGLIAGGPLAQNRIKWMAFVTQAGVAIGLAKEVAVEFPELGTAFATLIISIVVINEMIGPIFFKYALGRAGEAHPRAEGAGFDGAHDALIFGGDPEAVALARQLRSHGWQVRIACSSSVRVPGLEAHELEVQPVEAFDLETLRRLEAGRADAIIALLDDDQNYAICEMAYEEWGTPVLVVRLRDRLYTSRFQELGVLIVDPGTAIVSLMDHVVRSPATASMLLGADDQQDIVDIAVRDPALDGVAIAQLRLPLDTVILSIHRNGELIIPHGYTLLHTGDRLTMLGSLESLDAVALRFDS